MPSATQKANFALFAGFYVAAQVVERALEVISGLFPLALGASGETQARRRKPREQKTTQELAQDKADRGSELLGFGFFLGVLVSGFVGLYFLEAIGFVVTRGVDVVATGLVISGGTKSLHEFIKLLERGKEL
jgi:hypothetical protein